VCGVSVQRNFRRNIHTVASTFAKQPLHTMTKFMVRLFLYCVHHVLTPLCVGSCRWQRSVSCCVCTFFWVVSSKKRHSLLRYWPCCCMLKACISNVNVSLRADGSVQCMWRISRNLLRVKRKAKHTRHLRMRYECPSNITNANVL
jgi:hypothetical protein